MSENIKKWEDRLKDDQRTFAMDVCMQAEIADLRAALAQRPPADEAPLSRLEIGGEGHAIFGKQEAIWHLQELLAPKADEAQVAVTDERLLQVAADSDYGDEDPKCILRLARAILAAAHAQPTAEEVTGGDVPWTTEQLEYIEAEVQRRTTECVKIMNRSDPDMSDFFDSIIPADKADQPEPSRPSGNAGEGVADPRLADMAMLIRRLARQLEKDSPGTDLAPQALDYLKRKGLQGSPLRSEPAPSMSKFATLDDYKQAMAEHAKRAEPERELFEAWATGPDGDWIDLATARSADGYSEPEVEEQWKGWQAGRAAIQQQAGGDTPGGDHA